MELGNKIKQLRFKASLTQEQLGERLGLSAQAVSKWENGVAMPDIALLPDIAEIFGVSIDELFDLTAEQKLRRIENRMDTEEELDADVFAEYEEFLKARIAAGEDKQRSLSLLAHLYHHRLESFAVKADRYAREAIALAPEKKDCQWLLQEAEGAAGWDWNISNHSKTIDFFKELVDNGAEGACSPQPYYYLIENLLADHRAAEAEEYLEKYDALPGHKPFLSQSYRASIALARFDEAGADAIMEKALKDFAGDPGALFEAAQYYARKCDYDRAIELYEASYAAEEERPRFCDALQAIAMIWEIRGDYKKAADARRRVLENLRDEWHFTDEIIVAESERELERLLKK